MSKATDAINAVDENDPKLDELSLEEIKALANGQTEPETRVEDKKPAVTTEPVVEDDEIDDEEPTEYEYKIDLEDGSGVQVFKGASVEDVMNKLGEAQKHATRKIREQADQLKKYGAQAARDAADNEYVIGQEMLTQPTSAFKKMFKETTGVDIETFKTKWERVEALDTAQTAQAIESRKNEAANQFLVAHPEFVANKNNGARLERAVNLLVAEANSKNQQPDFAAFLESAFTDLSESGLLELKTEEPVEPVIPGAAAAVKKEVVTEPTVTVAAHTRRASGLSSRARTIATPKNTAPSEEELYAMSLDQLKELDRKSRQ
jgi:hypothetical protein